MEKLYALYEQSPHHMKEQLMRCISYFEYLLSSQDMRRIKAYRKYLTASIKTLEMYDPFAVEEDFENYDEDWEKEWEEDEDFETDFFYEEDGDNKWTS